MTTTSERKALEREAGYQSGVGRVWGFGREGDRFVAESLEPNPDLRGLEAVRVWDEMSRTDDQVGSALRALRTPVTSAGWALTNTDDVEDNVVEFVRSNIGLPKAGESRARREHQGIVFSEHLAQAFKAAIYGHYVFEQVYDYSDPRFGGDGYTHLQKLAPRDPTTIREIQVGRDGGLKAVVQEPEPLGASRGQIPQPVPIPVESLVFYCVGRDGADWYGTSVLRQAYRPWFFKDRLERIGVQIVERNGMGVPVATVSNSADHGMVDEALANFRAGASAFAKFPEGVDFKLVGVSGSTVDPLPQIKHYSQQISKALAQGFQDLGHDSGARSLGETFLKVALRASQEIADLIADTFTEHVIRDLVELNFGEGTPYPVLSPGDIVANGDTDSAVLVDLADAGLITPDQGLEKHLRAQHGLPELTEDDTPMEGDKADDLAKKATAAGVLIRAGFDPEAAMATAGLDPIKHSGLLPVTLQRPEDTRSVDKTLPNTVGLSESTETDKQLELVRELKALREARGHDR